MLTLRQEQFVGEYLKDLNATQAARRAGYSERSAYSTGHRLLKKAEVAAAIAERTAARLEAADVDADRVIRELAVIAFGDIRSAFDEHGRLRPVHELPESAARLISSIDVSEDRDGDVVRKVRVWDKVAALGVLAKHLGLLREQLDVHGSVDYRWMGDADIEEQRTIDADAVRVEDGGNGGNGGQNGPTAALTAGRPVEVQRAGPAGNGAGRGSRAASGPSGGSSVEWDDEADG